MLGDTVNDFMLNSSPPAGKDELYSLFPQTNTTPNVSLPNYIAGSPSATDTLSKTPTVAEAVKTNEAKMAEDKSIADARQSQMQQGQTLDKAGLNGRAAINGLKDFGANLMAPTPYNPAQLGFQSVVPNLSNFANPQMPQQMPIQQIQPPQMMMSQMQQGIMPSPVPQMNAMSDIRTKWEIKQASKDMDSLLNKVYQNLLNKRAK